jgi:hypothetical protein
MRSLFTLSAVAALITCSVTTRIEAAKSWAPHPTQLLVKYQDSLLPVVHLEGSDPVVVVDGKEKRLRNEPLYLPKRAPTFGPEYVELTNTSLGGVQIRYVADLADVVEGPARTGDHGGIAEFSATVKSKRTLKGGFIAAVLYSDKLFTSEDSLYKTQIIVRELPDLPAGVAVPVKLMSKMFTFVPGQIYFVQVFDAEGREAMTNVARNGWPYYSMLERHRMKGAIERYREKYAGQNHPVAPAVMINPVLPDDFTPPNEPMSARLSISAQGIVADVNLNRSRDEAVNQAVREALKGWLFFPRLINGQPVESQVEVPIKF